MESLSFIQAFMEGLFMKRIIMIAAALGSLVLLGGCGKGFNCKLDKRTITIITEPEGASVGQINLPGQPRTNLGISPIEEQPVIVISEVTKIKNLPYEQAEDIMKRVGFIHVMIQKDGYIPYTGYLKTEHGKTISHTITLKKK